LLVKARVASGDFQDVFVEMEQAFKRGGGGKGRSPLRIEAAERKVVRRCMNMRAGGN
jgi:hypothetical protein